GAVHGGDERLRERALRDTAEAAPLRHQLEAATGCHHLEVGSGGEHRSAAGDDDRPDLFVGLELVERALDAPRHVAVHGVAGLGTVDREDLDLAAALPLEDHPPDRIGGSRRRSTMPDATAARRARAWGRIEEVAMLETRETPEQVPETLPAQQAG